MAIRGRFKSQIPATLQGAGGITVAKVNGVWTIEPDWTALALETTLPDPENRQLWVFDPLTDTYVRLSLQAVIDELPAGPTGQTGATGPVNGIKQAYSTTTTDSDPGAGTFRLNHATPASATAAYLDNVDSGAATVSGIIDLWDDSTNTTKGYLRFEKSTDPTVWAQFTVTGSVVDGTGYRKLTLGGGAGSGAFTNGDTFAITFFRSGDKGADGAGAGDVVGPPSAVDSQFAAYDTTTGKLIKDSGYAAIDEDSMSSNSATKLPTQQSVRAYADARSAGGLVLTNGRLTWTVSSDALTIALKTDAGTDPSASDPVYARVRDVSAGTDVEAVLMITSALSLVISSGSTMGFSNNTPARLWAVLFNDGGTPRIGAIKCASTTTIFPLGRWAIASSTAEGGAGGADSALVFYTGTAVTSKAYGVLGYGTWETGLTTAGTWAAAPDRVQLYKAGVALPGDTFNYKFALISTQISTAAETWTNSNVTVSITPTSAANAVMVTWSSVGQQTTDSVGALFSVLKGGVPVGQITGFYAAGAVLNNAISGFCIDNPGTTSSVTYTVGVMNQGSGGGINFPGFGGQPSPMTAVEIMT